MLCIFQVASEDTVLYTAQTYADKRQAGSRRQRLAVQKLTPLVRCPHLSQFWVMASALSDDADKLLLSRLQPQLKRLLLAGQDSKLLSPSRMLRSTGAGPGNINTRSPDVPASWMLPVRDIQLVSSTKVQWEVDVAAIRQAAKDSASRQEKTILGSKTSCVLGGVRWGMQLQFRWDAGKKGSTVALLAHAESLPAGSFCPCTYSLACAAPAISPFGRTRLFEADAGGTRGITDFFKLGAMPGGFDEVAWVAKGLPSQGSIVLLLTVANVGK
jgi:hypothetical protein